MSSSARPVCLIVPGLNDSGIDHWQSRWVAQRPDCHKVELGCWDAPIRNVWLSRLDQAIGQCDRPAILVAHSLGCLAVAWWAALVGDAARNRIAAALLVAPPDVDRDSVPTVLRPFAPCPRQALPFPTTLVASRNDSYADFSALKRMAAQWGSTLHDIGAAGHINAQSALGDWPEGQGLLDRLIAPKVRRLPGRPEQPGRTRPSA